jgi:voltage-gated potassium channel Kch
MRIFSNIGRLFRGLRRALQEPEVQGVGTLALALILLATVFYWLVEGWSLLDSAYFAVVTIATVGYGDFSPQTTLGKLFTMGYIFAGIGIFVAAVSAVAQAILRSEHSEAPPK